VFQDVAETPKGKAGHMGDLQKVHRALIPNMGIVSFSARMSRRLVIVELKQSVGLLT